MEKHTQLPNETSSLEPEDRLVYLSIKRFQNGKTKECFPSLAVISKTCGRSINFIRQSITRLVSEGYLTLEKKGKYTYYHFSPYKTFECFTDQFLDYPDLTPLEKAYIASIQQYMYVQPDNTGHISLDNMELSDRINMPMKTIEKCQKRLKDLNILTIVPTKATGTGGCTRRLYIYHMYAMGQLVYAFKHLKDKVDLLDQDIESLKKADDLKDQQIKELQKKVRILENALLEKQKEEYKEPTIIL